MNRGLPIRRLTLALALAGAAALASGFWFAQPPPSPLQAWSQAPPELRALLWPEPREIEAFALSDQHGRPFTQADFRGQWSFVFFGFLQCPDVCPTTLSALRELRQAQRAQDPDAGSHRVVFVSVDPAHDRPETIASYLGFFDPDFIGLSGAAQALQPLTRSLAIKAVEVVAESGSRSIDHTSSVILIAPDGRAVGALPPPHNPQRMQADFARLRQYLRR